MIEIALYKDRDNLLLLLQAVCNSYRNSLNKCYKNFVMALQDICNQELPS